MKRIWLVYEKDNVARNVFFIEQWEKAAEKRGVKIHLALYEDLSFGLKGGKPFIRHAGGLPLPDAAVMRLYQPILGEQFEAMGIPIFNNARVARICNDKRLTHQLVSGIVPAMDTVFLRGDEKTCPFPFPVVVKGVHGCGGRQVYAAKDAESFQTAMDALFPNPIMVQAMSDTPGRDVRVYVLGRETVAVMMRYSDHDFRSNLGQGGGAVPYTLSREEENVVEQIKALFDFGLAGIDFIFHQGQLVFNEIEDAVGTRMLFANGHEDIVERYLDFILHTFDKN